jgi:hypothetical protein
MQVKTHNRWRVNKSNACQTIADLGFPEIGRPELQGPSTTLPAKFSQFWGRKLESPSMHKRRCSYPWQGNCAAGACANP